MIKITKVKNEYLIEYIDHLNHIDYFEGKDYNSKSVKDKMIRERIEEVKSKLEKLKSDVNASSGNKS